jgi:ABC-type Fe3+-hydroxamate transport system substrate-binding protein
MESVKQNRVVLIPGWIAGCISIDRVKGYEILAKALHPELF